MLETFTAAEVNAGRFGTGDISADPLFVDRNASPPDVHLQTGSPCIDTGADLGEAFERTAPDIGRYESGAP